MKTAEANEMYSKFMQQLGKAYKPEKIKGKERAILNIKRCERVCLLNRRYLRRSIWSHDDG
jgi:hypothetical protein